VELSFAGFSQAQSKPLVFAYMTAHGAASRLVQSSNFFELRNALAQLSSDTRLQCHTARRATDAGTMKAHIDDAIVNCNDFHITAVGLNIWTNQVNHRSNSAQELIA